jgi:hypothetical protein
VSTARARRLWDGGAAVCRSVRRTNAGLVEDWFHKGAETSWFRCQLGLPTWNVVIPR